MRSARTAAMVSVLALLASPAAAELDPAAAAPETFEDCDALVRRHPRDPEAYRCFHTVAARDGEWEEAIRRLVAMLSIHPDRHWARFYMARAMFPLGRYDEELMRTAIAGFVEEGDLVGEIRTRQHLALGYRKQGRLDDSREQLQKALERSERAGDPGLRAGVLAALGWQARGEGDVRLARQRFMEAEAIVFPEGNLGDQLNVLDGLAAVSFDIGRFHDAWEFYGRQRELVGHEDVDRVPALLQNMSFVAQRLAMEGALSPETFLRLREESLAMAIRLGDRGRELRGRILLASRLEGRAAVEEAERAVALARDLGHADLCWALWILAEKTLSLDLTDPALYRAGRGYADEAIRFARERADRARVAQGLAVRAALSERAGETEASLADHLEAFDAIESIRDLQLDREVRPRLFARYAHVYRRLARSLLRLEPPSEEDLALALTTLERLRARELLDRQDAGGGRSAASEGPMAEERSGVLTEIASVQRRLLDPALPASGRQDLLDRLEQLEVKEGELRERIAREDPRFASLRRPTLATLDQVRDELTAREAMVLFAQAQTVDREQEVAERFFDMALVLRHDRADAFTLPVPSEIRHDIELLLALLSRRDGSELAAAARLGEKLLAEILDSLPAEVDRLILVPDGDLHRLPFGVLSLEDDPEPLAARFEISLIPSATAWLRWRRGEPDAAVRSVLALADPVLPEAAAAADATRGGGILQQAPHLGPLPHARKEAEVVLRRLGGHGRILAGEAASEHALKAADLSGVRVLHMAAHALVDDRNPERSAIVLSPGADDEDGLLQFREILELDLADQLVVLSACRSGSGPVIGGEGVLGLASAFFQAGARTVVAALSPLRDDEASELVEELGRHLGRGLGAGAALAAARRALIRSGAPAAAWAGVVVLGDADLVPVPGGHGPVPAATLWIGVIVLLAAAGTALTRIRRPGGRSTR